MTICSKTQGRRRTAQKRRAGAIRFPCGVGVPALRNPLKIDPFRSLG